MTRRGRVKEAGGCRWGDTHPVSSSRMAWRRLAFQGLLEAVQEDFEAFHAVGDGLRGGHVHAGLLEDVDGVVRGAGLEEAQVGLQGPGLVLQEALGQGGGGRVTGGILIDVERAEKVRDAQPVDFRFNGIGPVWRRSRRRIRRSVI